MKHWKPTTQIERGLYHDLRKALRISKSEILLLDEIISRLAVRLYGYDCNWRRAKGEEERPFVVRKLRDSQSKRRVKLDEMRATYSERI